VADQTDETPSAPVPRAVQVAVIVLAAQALAFVALAVIVVVKAALGSATSVPGALLGGALALVGAAVLGLCARSLLALRPAARAPALVLELLALPVSYDLTFPAHRPGYGAPILISALAVIYLLFTPPARAALDRDR
jgi:hypothetical protein